MKTTTSSNKTKKVAKKGVSDKLKDIPVDLDKEFFEVFKRFCTEHDMLLETYYRDYDGTGIKCLALFDIGDFKKIKEFFNERFHGNE